MNRNLDTRFDRNGQRRSASKRGRTDRPRGRSAAPRVDRLEDRTLLTTSLDNAFGGDGRVTLPFNFQNLNAADATVDSMGRIVAVGTASANFFVARYLPDGTLDPTFSGDGLVAVDFGGFDTAAAVTIGPSDRIVVAGTTNVAGSNDFAVAVLLADGTPDNQFDGDGQRTIDFVPEAGGSIGDTASDVTLDGNGNIVVVGTVDFGGGDTDFGIARLMPTGMLDPAFDANGLQTILFDLGPAGRRTDRAAAVAIQADGRIVVAGTVDVGAATDRDYGVTRLFANGSLDGEFNAAAAGPTGIVAGKAVVSFNLTGGNNQDTLADMAIDAGGRIVLVGTVNKGGAGGDTDIGFARLRTTVPNAGTLDPAFGDSDSGKKVIAPNRTANGIDTAEGLALQGDAIAAAATIQISATNSEFGLIRLDQNGQPPAGFGTNAAVTFDNSDAAAALVTTGSDFVILGALTSAMLGIKDFLLIRTDVAGAPVASFGQSGRTITHFGRADGEATDVAVDAMGRYLVVGSFNFISTPLNRDVGIARVRPDGTLDPSFRGDGQFFDFGFDGAADEDELATAVTTDASNRILVVGTTTPVGGGNARLFVLRFQPNGDADPSFSPAGAPGELTVDGPFSPGSREDAVAVAVLPGTGEILVGATITGPDGSRDFAVFKFNSDGSPSPFSGTAPSISGNVATVDFDDAAFTSERLAGMAVQPDGKIVLAGTFPHGGGSTNTDFAVARLDPDGTRDIPFGDQEGRTLIAFDRGGDNRDEATAVALTSGGNIVVAGTAAVGTADRDFAVTELNPMGMPVTGFGTNGQATVAFNRGGDFVDRANAVALDGSQIVLAGTVAVDSAGGTDIGVARLNADGTPDAGFNPMGQFTVDFNLGDTDADRGNAVALPAAGQVLVAGAAGADTPPGGTYFALARASVVTDTTPPTISSVGPVTSPRNSAVDTVDVTFSEAIAPASFTAADLSLTRDGAAVTLTGVTVTQVNPTTFRVNGLTGPTTAPGSYVLTVNAAGITDLAGNAGTGSSTANFVVDTTAPTVAAVGPVTSPRRSPVDTVDVTFSEAVTPASVTTAALGLTRDGAAVALSGVTVTQVNATTFRVNGLTGPTTAPGSYVLTVNGAGVTDLAGNAGTGSATASFVVQTPAAVDGDYDGDGMTDPATYTYDSAAGAAVFHITLSNHGSPMTVERRITGVGPNVIPVTGDFDGDRIDDVAVVDPMARLNGSDTPNASVWTILLSASGGARRDVPFGAAGTLDRPAPADFDGDGITDIATFRANSDIVPGAAQWFILPSGPNPGFATTDGAFPVVFGAPGGADLPSPADIDGDGRADLVGFRPIATAEDIARDPSLAGVAQWFVLPSSRNDATFSGRIGGFPIVFGAASNADQPAVADYDHDGRADITASRSMSDLSAFPDQAIFFILPSMPNSASYTPPLVGGFARGFGQSGDIAAVGDYDGDGRPDLALFNTTTGVLRYRTGTEPPETTVDTGQTGSNVVPVLAPLFFRLRATGNPTGVATAATAAQRAAPAQAAEKPLGSLVDVADEDLYGSA